MRRPTPTSIERIVSALTDARREALLVVIRVLGGEGPPLDVEAGVLRYGLHLEIDELPERQLVAVAVLLRALRGT